MPPTTTTLLFYSIRGLTLYASESVILHPKRMFPIVKFIVFIELVRPTAHSVPPKVASRPQFYCRQQHILQYIQYQPRDFSKCWILCNSSLSRNQLHMATQYGRHKHIVWRNHNSASTSLPIFYRTIIIAHRMTLTAAIFPSGILELPYYDSARRMTLTAAISPPHSHFQTQNLDR